MVLDRIMRQLVIFSYFNAKAYIDLDFLVLRFDFITLLGLDLPFGELFSERSSKSSSGLYVFNYKSNSM